MQFGQSSGFVDITKGISALLAPIATTAISVYQTKELQKLEKARLKADAAAQAALLSLQPQQVVVQSSSGLLIGVLVGGVALLGIIVFMINRNSSNVGETAESTGLSPESTPKIKRIKRVSRPK